MDVEDFGGMDDELAKTQTSQELVESELDVPALVRLLLDVIPESVAGCPHFSGDDCRIAQA